MQCFLPFVFRQGFKATKWPAWGSGHSPTVWTVGETTPTICSSPAYAPRGTLRYVHSCSGVLPGQGLAAEGLPAHCLLGSRSHILSQCLGESSEKKEARSEALAVVKSTRLRTSWDSRATPCQLCGLGRLLTVSELGFLTCKRKMNILALISWGSSEDCVNPQNEAGRGVSCLLFAVTIIQAQKPGRRK